MKSGPQRSLCLLRHCHSKPSTHGGPGQASQSYNNRILVSSCSVQATGPASNVNMTSNKQSPCPLPPQEGTKKSITKQPESIRQGRQCGSEICGPGPISGCGRSSGSSPFTLLLKTAQRIPFFSYCKTHLSRKRRYQMRDVPSLLFRAVVPNLCGTRNQFHRRLFFQRWRVDGWEGRDGFRITQAHYSALYFYYYYISSNSYHQALDPRGWASLVYRKLFVFPCVHVCVYMRRSTLMREKSRG